MDQSYLQQLINEAKARDGGMILSLDGRPEAVVLLIEKYNQLISNLYPPANGSISNQAAESQEESALFKPKRVLLTGGAGYIGAHLARQLINAGHKVIILDNLSLGKKENMPSEAKFIEGDVGDINLLRDIFASQKIDTVMHLAASIEVEESVKEPARYLENNALNTAKLLAIMDEAKVKNFIFSSTAAVYGPQETQPISEDAPLKPNNPYGFSKLIAEEIIKYYCQARDFKAVVFRYFNVCGCDFDGKAKSTHDSHLLGKLIKVVTGESEAVVVNGNDYGTADGTCVRDYVHVLDVVSAHISALERMERASGFNVYNIGTGKGISVLEMVNAVSENLNKMIPMQLGPRRPGDSPAAVADADKIRRALGFEAKFSDIATIAKTAFHQAQNNRHSGDGANSYLTE